MAVGGLRLEHPIYASHPILVTTESDRIQELIILYLASFIDILSYLEKGQSKLEWSQLFILTHLDCVVHWENGQLKNSIFLLGPWHPLVLSKRFMVQSALIERAQLFLAKEGKKCLAKIASLLEGVQGFRWFPAVSADDRQLVPAYVSSTSDPGWHVAFKTNLFLDEDKGKASDLRHLIRTSLGLDTNFAFAGNDDMAASCLSSYRQAYPSRRAIGVRVCHGYSPESVVQAVDRFLHKEDAPTLDGCQLPGGVSLFLQQELAQDAEFQRSDPPIRIFRYQDDEDCIREGNPDIYMISPDQSLSFRAGQEKFELPRGHGLGSVFYEPISWLTEGQSQLPKSVTYDRDQGENNVVPHTLGECFVFSLQKISRLFNNSISLVQTVSLPINLNSPWAVSPGGNLDPAIFVKYVRDGVSRSLEERALWDYRIDISSRPSSYYVLSRIPKGFSVAVNGLFGLQDVATSFIVELGELGIAIGGEALRSGRHAMGVVGLVGSVRMLRDGGPDLPGLLRNDEKHVSFLVPVDAFSTLFGHDGSKRTDLLVIQIIFPESPQDKLRIFACGIESKYVSATYGHGSAIEALRQAKTTIEQLRSLLEVSLLPGESQNDWACLES